MAHDHEDSAAFNSEWCSKRIDKALTNSVTATKRREEEGILFPKINSTTGFHSLINILEIKQK